MTPKYATAAPLVVPSPTPTQPQISPPTTLALGATYIVQGPDGTREIAATDFYKGFLESALAQDEMLTEIRVPKMGGAGWNFQKFNRRAQDWAIVGVAAWVRGNESGVALVNMGSTPILATSVSTALAYGRPSRMPPNSPPQTPNHKPTTTPASSTAPTSPKHSSAEPSKPPADTNLRTATLKAMSFAATIWRRFPGWRWLVVALAIGVSIRVPLLVAAHADGVPGDQLQYSSQALSNALGDWYQQPFEPNKPAADHPPLTSALLTPITWLTRDGSFILAQRLMVLLFGMLNIGLIHALGRRISSRVGAIAALLAAIDVHLFLGDVLILSETFGVTLVTSILLLLIETPDDALTTKRLAIVGALVGLLLLTRPELIVLTPLLCVWIWWRLPNHRSPTTVLRSTLVGLVATVMVAPWVLWNFSRFEERALLSTNDGLTLLGANCDDTYFGENVGGYSFTCALAVTGKPGDDASQVSSLRTSAATSYARRHISRLPIVAGARVLRQWEVGFIGRTAADSPLEGRPKELVLLGSVQWWLFGVVGVVGARIVSRRALTLLMLAPLVITFAALTVNAQWRLRVAAEPSIVLLAAVGASSLLTRLGERQAPINTN